MSDTLNLFAPIVIQIGEGHTLAFHPDPLLDDAWMRLVSAGSVNVDESKFKGLSPEKRQIAEAKAKAAVLKRRRDQIIDALADLAHTPVDADALRALNLGIVGATNLMKVYTEAVTAGFPTTA